MPGDKRAFEEEGRRPSDKKQRLNLASVVAEAVKNDGLQKLCQSLEPLVRRVVGEEIERALGKLRLQSLNLEAPRMISNQAERAAATQLRLEFKNGVAMSLFTGSRIEGEQGTQIRVVLQDAHSGRIVTSGDEAFLKLELVVLDGDFCPDDDENWSEEEFSSHQVRERDGKGPLLAGDVNFSLKHGVGVIGELSFTDNSSWIRSRKFKLGARVAPPFYKGQRIREAKSEAFVVKDHRGELYKKHYPPELQDDVWRLDKIGKDGAFHRRLYKSGIRTVEDFLRLAVMDPHRLRNILGSGMSNKMWEGTIEHAKTCVLSSKLYVYYADTNVGIIFNTIYQLMGLISDTRYRSADSLSHQEKVYVDKLVRVAYDNWNRVVEYEGEATGELPAEVLASEVVNDELPQEVNRERSSEVNRERSSEVNWERSSEVNRERSSEVNWERSSEVNRERSSEVKGPDRVDDAPMWSPVASASTPCSEWLFYKEMRTPSFCDEFDNCVGMESDEINGQMQQLLLMLATSTSKKAAVRGRWLKIKAAMRWGISIRNIAAARRTRMERAAA